MLFGTLGLLLRSLHCPYRIVSRLLVREAGLYCDEAVVHEIALFLRDRRGMDPYARNHGEAPEGAGVSAALSEDLIVRRGLDSGISDEALREQSCPSVLRDVMHTAIDKASREGRPGALAPLPLFVEDARTTAKDRADSVLDERLADWLLSDEAAEWRQNRQALFPHHPLASDSGA